MKKLKNMSKEQLKKLSMKLGIIGIVIILLYIIWLIFLEKTVIFMSYEERFQNSVEKYLERNENYVPENGRMRSFTLQEAYEKGILDTLYVPKTKNMCDVDSWVKVKVDEDGEINYYTYLKCGKYESKTDHTGPVITLNGDSSILNPLGNEYKDLGVKSVVDDKDGKIDTKNVIINTNKVLSNKTGTYEVTYKVYDSLRNVTTITRKVTVVEKLSDRIKKDTNGTSLYAGVDLNNYVLFSGMVWQILGINEDGTIKLVLFDNAVNMAYDGGNFNDSQIKEWLNSVFYKSLTNAEKYIVKDNKWCVDTVSSYDTASTDCTTYSEPSTVGMLSIADYKKSLVGDKSYLMTRNSYRFLNKVDTINSWIKYSYKGKPIHSYDDTSLVGIRPVIILKDNLFILSGDGRTDTPFKLNDYKTGNENDLVKDRIIGEYVYYSGSYWRITGKDSEGNVKMTMAETFRIAKTSEVLNAKYEDNVKRIFDPTEKGNLGYKINNEIIDYIDDKYLVSKSWDLPLYSMEKKYSELEKKTFKAKISIPTSYDLFSGCNGNDSLRKGSYWLLDYMDDEVDLFMINESNGLAFIVDRALYETNGLKLTVYIKGNSKISSGMGIFSSPYYIK